MRQSELERLKDEQLELFMSIEDARATIRCLGPSKSRQILIDALREDLARYKQIGEEIKRLQK